MGIKPFGFTPDEVKHCLNDPKSGENRPALNHTLT
jgi:hypothetical protein